MVRIEKIKHFNIYQVDDGYVVQNMKMGKFSHSHISNYKTAKWICELSLRKKLPHDIPKYLLISLLRINDDEKYVAKIKDLLKAKSKKKDMYFNSNKGVRKNKCQNTAYHIRGINLK